MAQGNNTTKQRVLAIARDLFNQNGYENVTINDICNDSGINKHTFYYYFKSKDELLKDYYKLPRHLSAEDFTLIMDADSCVEQFWLLSKRLFEFVEETGPEIIKQMHIKNLCEDIGTFRFSAEEKEIFQATVSIIRKGQERGEFLNKTDPKALLILFKQSLFGTMLAWSMRRGSFDFPRAARFLYENLFDVAIQYRYADAVTAGEIWGE